jgi:hypothetical protein
LKMGAPARFSGNRNVLLATRKVTSGNRESKVGPERGAPCMTARGSRALAHRCSTSRRLPALRGRDMNLMYRLQRCLAGI